MLQQKVYYFYTVLMTFQLIEFWVFPSPISKYKTLNFQDKICSGLQACFFRNKSLHEKLFTVHLNPD